MEDSWQVGHDGNQNGHYGWHLTKVRQGTERPQGLLANLRFGWKFAGPYERRYNRIARVAYGYTSYGRWDEPGKSRRDHERVGKTRVGG